MEAKKINWLGLAGEVAIIVLVIFSSFCFSMVAAYNWPRSWTS